LGARRMGLVRLDRGCKVEVAWLVDRRAVCF